MVNLKVGKSRANTDLALFSLPGDEIHVWRAALDQPSLVMDTLERTLSGDERARATRLIFERDRRFFIACRGILRSLLGAYLHVDPKEVAFRYGTHGKPFLMEQFSEDNITFNLSHADGLALIAITRKRQLGIDIECVRPIPEAATIARQFFSPAENTAIQSLPPDDQITAFYHCWTRKEAWLKAMGSGFSNALDTFDVSVGPGEPAALLSVRGSPDEPAHWALQTLTPAPGFVSTVAVEGHDWRLMSYEWTALDMPGSFAR